ncbi:MAG TPA: 4-hydroxyphenylacetate 3-hydroxylase N-terminal domain-containing protein [Chloroflexota bacterium]|nr:4-hydroxyphenylacetate 3-hydroxylase N-terminal domain-containing protein [Chloroflexota bacterium]
MPARTGKQYAAALRDGRRVFQGGRRIEDVTAHPGFAGTVRTLSRLYDLQHTPEHGPLMTAEWEGECISLSYLPPRTAEDLAAKRRNIAFWAEQTLGQMGRYPDFCSELAVGLVDAADWLAQADKRFAANAVAYHRFCAANDLCLTHALNDQFYDRSKRVGEQPDPDLILHVVRETPEGPIVRGLRNLATLAPLSDEALVYPNRPRTPDEADYALAFAIPMNAPGLSILCRDLYAEHADPERLPLTARFDEVDATLLFDDLLVPWERVFVYRDADMAAQFHRRINLWAGYSTLIRLGIRLEVFAGVAQLLGEWSGKTNPEALGLMGHLLQDIEVLRACLDEADLRAGKTAAGYWAPHLSEAFRLQGIEASDRAARILQDLLTSSLILTGGVTDLPSELGPQVDRFFRNQAPNTRDHLRLLAVAADLVQSAFGARNLLYERLQSGEPENTRRRLASRYDTSALTERVLRFLREGWEVSQ